MADKKQEVSPGLTVLYCMLVAGGVALAAFIFIGTWWIFLGYGLWKLLVTNRETRQKYISETLKNLTPTDVYMLLFFICAVLFELTWLLKYDHPTY